MMTDPAAVLEAARALGADAAALVSASDIRVDARFADACSQNRCGQHAANWACPPAQSPERLKALLPSYRECLVFQTRGPLDDPFDYEGMKKAQDRFTALCRRLRGNLDGALVLGTGPCLRCARCAWPDPCRFPGSMELNLEGMGVDVTALCEGARLPYCQSGHVVFTGAALLP